MITAEEEGAVMAGKEPTGKNSGQPELHDAVDAKAGETQTAGTKPATRKASPETPDLKTRHKAV
jgi:hypothetical protein